jgi:hypothetical protein
MVKGPFGHTGSRQDFIQAHSGIAFGGHDSLAYIKDFLADV